MQATLTRGVLRGGEQPPLSARSPEAAARRPLVGGTSKFSIQTKPLITLSYHSKGNVIYYGFESQSEDEVSRDFEIGSALQETTGYPLIFTQNSTGGYKDWCIDSLKIPAYTIEVGDESIPHPLGLETLPEMFERNKDVPIVMLNKAKEYQNVIDSMI